MNISRMRRRLCGAFRLIDMTVVIGAASVMALLILPMLSAAEERARREACRGNLHQLGASIESYVDDYGGYYPCWPGAGAEDWMFTDDAGSPVSAHRQCASKTAAGVMCSWNTVETIRHGSGPHCARFPADDMKALYGGKPEDPPLLTGTPLIAYYRCIGVGRNKPHDASGEKGPWGRTAYDSGLSMAPNGMGYLLVMGYLPDARTFYCPSSDGMPSDELYNTTGGYRLSDWKDAGGFDRNSMLYGHWNNIAGQWVQRAAIFSHYAYRNVPLLVTDPWCVTLEEAKDPRLTLTLTRPLQNLRFGAAIFPTQKELGARALAADAFSKTCHKEDETYVDALGRAYSFAQTKENNSTRAGMGIVGHREGYNVLYGDGSAKWHGDPERRIIWHQQSYNPPHLRSHYQPEARGATSFNLLASNYFYNEPGVLTNGYGPYGGTDKEWGCFADTSAAVWHDLDIANGMDVFEPLEGTTVTAGP